MSNRGRSQRKGQSGVRPADWDFYNFPTFFGFSVGLFLAAILSAMGFLPIVFTVSLVFLGFGVAHLVTRLLARNVLDRRRDKAEEEERERRALAVRARVAEAAVQGEGEAASGEVRRRKRRRR